MKHDRVLFLLICVMLSGLLSFFVLQNNDFTIQDIGRHLMNGKLLLQGHTEVLYKNVYSYAMPNQSFINHHWFAGIVFYILYTAGEFHLLAVFLAGVMVAALCISLDAIRRRSSVLITIIVGLPLTLFLAGRHELRPEMLGYFFFSLCLWFFARLKKDQFFSGKIVLIFCLMQVVWVNVHITFFLEPLIVAVYLAEYILVKQRILAKKFAQLFFALLVCTLINPNVFFGALEPLSIFHNYGYTIVENMTIPFLLPILADPVVPLYVIVAGVSLIIVAAAIKKLPLHSMVFAIVGIVMGFMALRNLPLFALFTLPVVAEALAILLKNVQSKSTNAYVSLQLLLGMFVLLVYLGAFITVLSGVYAPNVTFAHMHADTVPYQFEATAFFKRERVPGPIFNNYDIGSYLIFGLYPEQRVFVDNRPEAYTNEFFQSLYIPMQERDDVWQKALQTYGFQSIFFGHRDRTPWAITFLRTRLTDPDWKVVYIDAYSIIFVRNISENAVFIKQHAVDSSLLKENLSPLLQ